MQALPQWLAWKLSIPRRADCLIPALLCPTQGQNTVPRSTSINLAFVASATSVPAADPAALVQVSANIALVKNWTLHGVFWGSYMIYNPQVLRGSLQQLAAWLAEGKIHVPVSHR